MTRQSLKGNHVNVQALNIDAFAERMNVAIKNAGGVTKMAEKAGVSTAVLRKWRSGASEPTLSNLIKMAEVGGVSVQWLATGNELPGLEKPEQTVNLDVNEYALVPRYDIQVSAGHGALVEQEEEVGYYPFKRKWLRQEGLSPKDLALVTVKGDSMAPTLNEGDMLLVDRSEHQVRRDSIYVLRVGDDVIAKRLQRDFADGLWIRSDNDQYEDQHLDKSASAALNIVGRVVWFGRRI